jgi:hypothetical protein
MSDSQVKMGAFHAPAWAGVVVSDHPGQGAAFRFLVSRRGERADWLDMTNLLNEVGPAASDGLYARLGFDTTRPFTRPKDGTDQPLGNTTFTLEWSRVDENRLVARASAEFKGVCELRGYFPWDWTGSWAIDRSDLVAQWGDRPSGLLVQIVHRPALRRSERGRAILDSTGDAGVRFDVDLGSMIYVDCQLIQGEPEAVRPPPDIDEIDAIMADARSQYDERRAFVSGDWAGLAESIAASSQWAVLLQPESGEPYLPAGREWIFPAPNGDPEPWMTFAWDSFLNALGLGVEAPDLADSAMRVVLETQYSNGNIPNWRGRYGGTPDRSQPPIGSFAFLKQYLRTGNHDLLEWAFPVLQRWNGWWYAAKGETRRRDGNANGLFNWGCDTEAISEEAPAWQTGLSPDRYARWESGQGDLPHWDESNWDANAETMDLDAVDLNSYLALDFECLAFIAKELGDGDREIWYLEQYRGLKKRINDTLWDDYFVSSLADQTRSGASSAPSLSENFDRLVDGESLSNTRYHYNPSDQSPAETKAELQGSDGYLKAAKHLTVDGMFNVNSTSVPAWQALFSGIRERQLVFRNSSGGLQQIDIPSGKLLSTASSTSSMASVIVNVLVPGAF